MLPKGLYRPVMNRLANNIKIRMNTLCITQGQLAERAGLSQVMVHKLLSGKTTETTKIVQLARALECTAEWLQFGESEENANASCIEVKSLGNELKVIGDSIPAGLNKALGSYLSQLTNQANDQLAIHVVKDNSMAPALQRESTICLNTADQEILNGDMYLISNRGLLQVRKLYMMPGSIVRLTSLNTSEYPEETIKLPSDASGDFTVVGRVIWFSTAC